MLRTSLLALSLTLFLTSCAKNDYVNVAKIATSSDPYGAMKNVAINKGTQYAQNPTQALKDFNYIKANFDQVLKAFLSTIIPMWGEGEAEEPTKDVYVKYTQDYKSRAKVDFEKGIVTVETIDAKSPKDSLESAIVTTILTPDDPEKVDLYSAKDVPIEGKPYLSGLIKDHQGKVVLYKWRASQYAKYLVAEKIQSKSIKTDSGSKNLYFVEFAMVQDHTDVGATKYASIAKKYAIKYGLDTSLVLAIMKTESNFNPYAVSHIPAYGLMQIVPTSAGRDVYRRLNGQDGVPTKNQLFNAETNILYGTTYLDILFDSYLKGIRNETSLEYCAISAYNTGAGNVFKVFHSDKTQALNSINAKNSSTIYSTLKSKLPYDETKRYLVKVTTAKKEFVRY